MHKCINEILICSFVMTGNVLKAASVLFACRKLLLSHSRVSSRPLNNGPDTRVKIYPLRCVPRKVNVVWSLSSLLSESCLKLDWPVPSCAEHL